MRDALVNRHYTVHLYGPGDWNFLARWKWQLFGPYEKVFAVWL